MDTPLPDREGELLEKYGNAEFSRDARARFPALRKELEEDGNLLHVQIGTLAKAVRAAVNSGDTELPLQICAFLDEVLSQPRAVAEIETAVAISFVEAEELRASSPGKTVLQHMPTRIRHVLLDQDPRGGARE